MEVEELNLKLVPS